ncbi:MAG: sensor histidine kinase [Flammeovirgaceae bacterium]|nr:MAG: sensor histidine kinase [Flammeovirgaceae bacterium]
MIFLLRVIRLIVLSFILFSGVLAQPAKTDSLKRITETATNDSIKVSALLQLAFQSIFNDSKTAWQQMEEAHRLLEKTKSYPYLETHARYVKAVYYDVTGTADSARFYFESGLEKTRSHGFTDLEVKFLNGLGLNNWNRGHYQTALDLFLQVNKQNQLLDKSKQIPQSTPLNNIGLIYQELGLYEKALEYHRKALEIRLRDAALLAQAATSYNNIGICLYHLKKYEEAEGIYRTGLALAREHKFLRQYYDLAGNMANTLAALNRYEEAQRFNLEIINHDPSIKLPDKFLMNIRSAAAGIYLNMGKPDAALPLIENGLALISQKPELEFYAPDLYRYASAYYYRRGDAQKGREYGNKQQEILEQRFSKRNAESLAEMEIKYQTAEKERKILDQQLVIEHGNLLLARQRSQNIMLVGALIVLALLTGIGYIYFRTRQKVREQQLLLSEKQQRLQAVLQATEEERQRIARDLHDGIGQQLSGAIMQLESVLHNNDQGTSQAHISLLVENLRKTSSEVRTLSHQMMPRSLTELGLVPAISDLLNRTFSGTSVQCSFHHYQAEERFNAQTELTLFRVVQELVNNIIRHAQAHNVSVNLLRMKDKLRLTVEDDGIGFKENTVNNGYGLMNIRSRLEGVNGTVLFERNGHAGTLVTVTIPVTN